MPSFFCSSLAACDRHQPRWIFVCVRTVYVTKNKVAEKLTIFYLALRCKISFHFFLLHQMFWDWLCSNATLKSYGEKMRHQSTRTSLDYNCRLLSYNSENSALSHCIFFTLLRQSCWSLLPTPCPFFPPSKLGWFFFWWKCGFIHSWNEKRDSR